MAMEKRYDSQNAEKETQTLWQKNKTYEFGNDTQKAYTIDTPPPTVSGKLHIGHIFSYTQTDIIARYKRLKGFDVFYPFGFDDNGLPTERFVEKKYDIRAHTLSRSEFINLCIKEAESAAKEFKQLWQQMGLSVDWNQTYSTISESSRRISQESFIKLYKKGYLYRKHEPALYCTRCRTAVAQAELDDSEHPSLFNDIVFKDAQGKELIIATTRPELLPSCVAVMYNPNDNRYKDLKNTKVRVPLFDLEVPVFEDETVLIEKGTGLVMVCTFGDKNDITWYKKYNLQYRQSIGNNGRFTALGQFLEGMTVPEARKAVLDKLREQNLLINQKEITHTVNVHERCKKEIEYIVLSQWFIQILPHKQKLLELADQINWYPEFMKARYVDWVSNLSWDWCISRQRFFGIPFPAWHCQSCNHVILAKIKDLPIDPQEIDAPTECPKCGKNDIVPDTDVMDTWNTSSLTPYICQNLIEQSLEKHEKNISKENDVSIENLNSTNNYTNGPMALPMGLRPQAHDIIRTWAFYTLIKTWMHDEKIAWHNIVISGHVLGRGNKKLSKKEGTALIPEKLLEKYPADAIRYWTASGRLGYDIQFSEDQLKIGIKLINKLWNAFRFCKPHIENITSEYTLHEIDAASQWLLHKITQTCKQYEQYLEQHEFSLALQAAENFFWSDFCDNYLELIKNRLFNPELYDQELIRSTQWTLHHVGLRILQLFGPFVPFVTENLFQKLYASNHKSNSIHTTLFTNIQIPYVFTDSTDDIEKIIAIVATIRRLKTEQELSLKTPIAQLEIAITDEKLVDRIAQHEQLLRGVTQSESIICKHSDNTKVLFEQVDGQWHARVSI